MRSDAVTLDTSVLEHYFNPDWNGDGHITALLGRIVSENRTLCFDDGQRIHDEMFHRLSNYRQHGEFGNFSQLMRGLLAAKEEVTVNHADGLMNCIDGCVRGSGAEQSDKVLIYVACKTDTLLVSNNASHITDHAGCLKECADHHAGTEPEFWDSDTATANL